MLYNILSVKRISWKQNSWNNIWGWENDLGLREGAPFHATQDFSYICFDYRHNPLTGKTCFTIVRQSLFYQKSVYNVHTMFVYFCWTKQLTPPTFSPCISVKLKCHDSAKWVKRLLRILCKSLKPATIAEETQRLLRKRNLARVPDGRFGWR